MTDEHWKHLNARVTALEVFAIALAQQADSPMLRALVKQQQEAWAVVSLNLDSSNEAAEEVIARIERLCVGAWGPAPQTPDVSPSKT